MNAAKFGRIAVNLFTFVVEHLLSTSLSFCMHGSRSVGIEQFGLPWLAAICIIMNEKCATLYKSQHKVPYVVISWNLI